MLQPKDVPIRPVQSVPNESHTKMIDNHGRHINYLRLSITDRCNLRCHYCRPAKGLPFIHHNEILRFEELERIVRIFSSLGVNKVRVTGGEPFSRRGCLPFFKRLKQIDGVKHLHITTNGVKTSRYLDELKDIGLGGINLSLDTQDPKKFWKITRRDYLPSVLQTLHGIIERKIPLKINSVILEDTSDQEILELAALAQQFPITLRFIELMPFSGTVRTKAIINGNLVKRLQRIFPLMTEIETDRPTTARIFSHQGYSGTLGLIQGYSRLFCKTCNKLRLTPTGMLKTCLYDNGALDIKRLLRQGENDEHIKEAIITAIKDRFVNGHEAEQFFIQESEPSMAKIGG